MTLKCPYSYLSAFGFLCLLGGMASHPLPKAALVLESANNILVRVGVAWESLWLSKDECAGWDPRMQPGRIGTECLAG